MRKILLFLLLMLLPLVTSARVEINGIYYYLSGNTATVTYTDELYKPSTYSGVVEIPNTISYNGASYTVTSIGESAFYSCEDLVGIVIPNSVTSISRVAFTRCTSLNNIVIPNSVSFIDEAAFELCSSLNRIVLSNTLVSIIFRVYKFN